MSIEREILSEQRVLRRHQGLQLFCYVRLPL